jgi:transposase
MADESSFLVDVPIERPGRVIVEKFGVAFHERYVGTLLGKLGFSHISARPRHPAQDGEIVEAYKKTSTRR